MQLQLLMNNNWQQGTCVCNVNHNVAMGTEQQMKANTLYCIVNRFTMEPKQEKCCSLYFEFARNPTRPHFILYKCYVRPLLEYAVPVWMFSVSARGTMSTTLDKLQATAARAYLNSKLKRRPDWTTSKEDLNVLSSWESLAWRRQILGLVYFRHVFSQYPSLLSHFQLPSSQSSRHPSSIILPKPGTFFRKSTLFSLSVAWNKLPEDIRSLSTTAKFSIAVRRYHSQSMFSLKGIPDFCV